MPDRPRLLDLFCGAGGAAMGYHRAGFEVVGVDIKPQPRYPFEFIQYDALGFVASHGKEFDAIHASPPCHEYSTATRHRKNRGITYPDLLPGTQKALRGIGKPYVIENVPGAKALLSDPMLLCGGMFDLGVMRHRYFESTLRSFRPLILATVPRLTVMLFRLHDTARQLGGIGKIQAQCLISRFGIRLWGLIG